MEKIGLHNLARPKGARSRRKYLGRGSSSGSGKTSGRGSKGQTSRAGRHFYAGFEGGQSPLIRRFAKRGFNAKFPKHFQTVNLEALKGFKDVTVTPELLREKGIVRKKSVPVKILGDGDLKNPLTIQAHAFSKSAEEKITKAGGKAEVINV